MIKNFAAIDFETANWHRTSICSVGIVIVHDHQIVDKLYHLIHPTPNFYCGWATEIHGLTRKDTDPAEDFSTVWKKIAPHINTLPLVAHNSPFDEGCLKAIHQALEIPYPNYEFYCTCRASRKTFPELVNHQLHTVSAHCGFNLDNHHHALADAEAAAHIALQIL